MDRRNNPYAPGAGLPQVAALAGKAKSYAERLFDYPQLGLWKPQTRAPRC